MALVIKLLLDRLCLLKEVADVSEELLPFLHGARYCCHPFVPGLIGPQRRRITAVYDAEWCVAEGCLIGGVEDILRPW
jgi:hypothetical protein